MLDLEGNEIDQDLKIEIVETSSARKLLVKTENIAMAGTYELQIVAESYTGLRNEETYTFELQLVFPDGFVLTEEEIDDLVSLEDDEEDEGEILLDITVPTSGGDDFEYQLPTSFDNGDESLDVDVILGDLDGVLEYDPETGLLSTIDGKDITPGDYRSIVVIVTTLPSGLISR